MVAFLCLLSPVPLERTEKVSAGGALSNSPARLGFLSTELQKLLSSRYPPPGTRVIARTESHHASERRLDSDQPCPIAIRGEVKDQTPGQTRSQPVYRPDECYVEYVNLIPRRNTADAAGVESARRAAMKPEGMSEHSRETALLSGTER